MSKGLLVLAFLFLLLPSILAEPNYIISNSEDWKDVYSSVLFANLQGIGSDFLISAAHGPILFDGLSKENKLFIISSKERPFVLDSLNLTLSAGFNSVEEIKTSSANLELISRLPDIKNFIVVGETSGDSALAVVAYALETHSWVFLASKSNIKEINSILTSREVGNLLLYGDIDSEVTETLLQYNPQLIKTGDRFQDDIEIVKEYSKIKSITQILLSNGEFIEKEIMQGRNALLFTGEDNFPDNIASYIKDSNIEIGVLVGNQNIDVATKIRQTTGINVMVKFARSARERTSGVSATEGLDLFPVPVSNTYYSNETIQIKSEENENNLEKIEFVEQNTNFSSKSTGEQISNCDGCTLEDKCVNICYIHSSQYCALTGEMLFQKEEGNSCENSCECLSGACVNNKCISGNLIQKILDWFSRLFG